jgi:hypothetical protein
MKREYSDSFFESEYFEDNKDGCAGFVLYRTHAGKKEKVASVIYWDAMGSYYIDTFGKGIPLPIAEELIAETKAVIDVPSMTLR